MFFGLYFKFHCNQSRKWVLPQNLHVPTILTTFCQATSLNVNALTEQKCSIIHLHLFNITYMQTISPTPRQYHPLLDNITYSYTTPPTPRQYYLHLVECEIFLSLQPYHQFTIINQKRAQKHYNRQMLKETINCIQPGQVFSRMVKENIRFGGKILECEN